MHLRSIGVGLDALGAHRPRTLLSTSGVVIGIDRVVLYLTGSARFTARDSSRAAIVVGTYAWQDTTEPVISGRALSADEL